MQLLQLKANIILTIHSGYSAHCVKYNVSKMSSNTSTELKNKIAVRQDLSPPISYKVIFLNDDVTTMEFVIHVLANLFSYDEVGAREITLKIHQDGKAIVAVLPFELAEQKVLETTTIARSNGFPFAVKIEPVD